MAAESRLRAAVLGASGFVGGELLRLLSLHPGIGEVRGFSATHAGRPWAALHPVLEHLEGGTFEEPAPAEAAAWADVLFLALPHGHSQRVVPEIAADALLVDLAADFRIQDRERFERVYGPHEAFELAGSFTYGLADVAAERLAGARRIAVPGCFATAALLALYPFVSSGLVDGDAVCFAVTGSSGAGAEPGRTTHHPLRAHNFFAYALAGHRHEAEVEDELQRWTAGAGPRCRLLTHSAPLVRGIHLTARLPVREPCVDPLALLREAYTRRLFVRVLERPPELAAVVGTNFCHLHAAISRGGREVIVVSVIDNLVKGAAGQAVQAMNLSLGLGEMTGLEFPGVYPC